MDIEQLDEKLDELNRKRKELQSQLKKVESRGDVKEVRRLKSEYSAVIKEEIKKLRKEKGHGKLGFEVVPVIIWSVMIYFYSRWIDSIVFGPLSVAVFMGVYIIFIYRD